MKKMNTTQKVIFILGILGVISAIYGKWNGWEDKSVFIPLYTGLSFMWIATLEEMSSCERALFRRIFGKKT